MVEERENACDDLVVEAAGSTDAVLSALAAPRRGGTVVLIGLPPHGATAAVPVDVDHARKIAAIHCYPTQVLALEAEWAFSKVLDAPSPEQHWRLAPPPEGWEVLTEL